MWCKHGAEPNYSSLKYNWCCKCNILILINRVRRGLGWGSPCQFSLFYYVPVSIFQNYQSDVDLLDITSIFVRCHRSWAAETPVKYECESKDITDTFEKKTKKKTEKKNRNNSIWEIYKQSFSNPTQTKWNYLTIHWVIEIWYVCIEPWQFNITVSSQLQVEAVVWPIYLTLVWLSIIRET